MECGYQCCCWKKTSSICRRQLYCSGNNYNTLYSFPQSPASLTSHRILRVLLALSHLYNNKMEIFYFPKSFLQILPSEEVPTAPAHRWLLHKTSTDLKSKNFGNKNINNKCHNNLCCYFINIICTSRCSGVFWTPTKLLISSQVDIKWILTANLHLSPPLLHFKWMTNSALLKKPQKKSPKT